MDSKSEASNEASGGRGRIRLNTCGRMEWSRRFCPGRGGSTRCDSGVSAGPMPDNIRSLCDSNTPLGTIISCFALYVSSVLADSDHADGVAIDDQALGARVRDGDGSVFANLRKRGREELHVVVVVAAWGQTLYRYLVLDACVLGPGVVNHGRLVPPVVRRTIAQFESACRSHDGVDVAWVGNARLNDEDPDQTPREGAPSGTTLDFRDAPSVMALPSLLSGADWHMPHYHIKLIIKRGADERPERDYFCSLTRTDPPYTRRWPGARCKATVFKLRDRPGRREDQTLQTAARQENRHTPSGSGRELLGQFATLKDVEKCQNYGYKLGGRSKHLLFCPKQLECPQPLLDSAALLRCRKDTVISLAKYSHPLGALPGALIWDARDQVLELKESVRATLHQVQATY
ncbi:hypothetical protein GGX14DRAFT_397969 [Mycena pura]|uniref:Uncharacterized protein n=1 Tax=Mycena pura TaxID=153505 RepID=A0AAD6YC41_9AGAR|nr:hypothetical protein GGX14DRAFT_397969 [Mycena pura]